MKHLFHGALAGVLFLTATEIPAAAQQPLYHLVASVPLGGSMKWDYLKVDPIHHWLLISHGTEITVVSLNTRRIAGELTGVEGSHGTAVDPATGDIWADSAEKSEAIAFNPQDLKPLASVPVLTDADGMAYDPASKTIFVSGGDGHGLTPIDPATRTAYPTIALGSTPESFAPDGKGNLYVALVDANEIVRIDTATRKIIATWPTTGCIHPTGLALDAGKRLIFTSCRGGTMDVLNADTGAVTATLPIGKGTDTAAFDPARHRAFSSNGDGTLSVVDDGSVPPTLLANVPTKPGARTMAVDPASGDVYTVTGKVISITQNNTPGGHPHYTFAPGSLTLYVYAPSS